MGHWRYIRPVSIAGLLIGAPVLVIPSLMVALVLCVHYGIKHISRGRQHRLREQVRRQIYARFKDRVKSGDRRYEKDGAFEDDAKAINDF